MNGQNIQSNGTAKATRRAMTTAAMLGTSVAFVSAIPAMAQTTNGGANVSQHSNSNLRPASYRIPDSAQPIMTRIAAMWMTATDRANDKSRPEGARESYRSAAAALKQALAAAHLRPTGHGGGRFDVDILLASNQVTDDINQLRATSAQMSGPRAGDLSQAAMLYGTGAKEFYTGSIRDALLTSNGKLASNGTGSASSGILGITSRRPNTTVPVTPYTPLPVGMDPSFGIGNWSFGSLAPFGGGATIFGGGGFGGNTVVMGPGGVASIPDTVNVPVVNGDGGTDVVPVSAPPVVIEPPAQP